MNAFLVRPLPFAAVTASSTAAGHDPAYVGNEYLGVTWRSDASGDSQSLTVDLGSNRNVDFAALLGCDGARSGWTLKVEVATSAQGVGFPAGSYASPVVPFLAGAEMWASGRGIGWWDGSLVTGRYVRLTIAGLAGLAATVGRLVLGPRLRFQRNFSFGGSVGVKDLGSYDFSARGVIQKRIAAKLPTLNITFSTIYQDEIDTILRPLIEQIGNTGEIFVCTDPVPNTQRQKRCFYGPLVASSGDISLVQRRADGWQWQAAVVSLVR